MVWPNRWQPAVAERLLAVHDACHSESKKEFSRTTMQNYFLRVIPTLKHYSTGNIGFDIPSGSIYDMAYLCWHSIWHSFPSYTLAFYLTFYPASILTYFPAYVLTFLLAFYLASDILSGAWLRSGSAHWDLELTVEDEEENEKEEEKTTLIKSRDPHLAGGKNHSRE